MSGSRPVEHPVPRPVVLRGAEVDLPGSTSDEVDGARSTSIGVPAAGTDPAGTPPKCVLERETAALVREWRLRRGLTQYELAEAAGAKQPHVSEVERCVTGLTLRKAERLLSSMGLRPRLVVEDLQQNPQTLPVTSDSSPDPSGGDP